MRGGELVLWKMEPLVSCLGGDVLVCFGLIFYII